MVADSVSNLPTEDSTVRYRCEACGNLTRFDVTSTRRTRSFHHYSVAGELSVEATEVLSEDIEEVSCRWCGNGSAVVSYVPARDGGADEVTQFDSGESGNNRS